MTEVVTLNINGNDRRVMADADTTLLSALRDQLGLLAAKRGCNQGVCGACTVWVDGAPHRSCLTLAGLCEGQEITTLEGLNADPLTRALQEKMVENGAFQCGFCAPGMMMSARRFAEDAGREVTAEDLRRAISGNLCRCTGYTKIIKALSEFMEARDDV